MKGYKFGADLYPPPIHIMEIAKKGGIKMRETLSVILVLIIVLGSFSMAFAATTVFVNKSLTFSSGNADCLISLEDFGSNISVSMKLYEDGSLVELWADSGTDSVTISDSYPAVSGSSYKLTFDCYVNGRRVSVTSITKICP